MKDLEKYKRYMIDYIFKGEEEEFYNKINWTDEKKLVEMKKDIVLIFDDEDCVCVFEYYGNIEDERNKVIGFMGCFYGEEKDYKKGEWLEKLKNFNVYQWNGYDYVIIKKEGLKIWK